MYTTNVLLFSVILLGADLYMLNIVFGLINSSSDMGVLIGSMIAILLTSGTTLAIFSIVDYVKTKILN